MTGNPAPSISVLTPVYNPPLDCLRACIDSVRNQSFTDWELILVDDASPGSQVRTVLEEAAARDGRIRVVSRAENGGIVAASNDALAAARGEFVAFLDHDDELALSALEEMQDAIRAEPAADVLYSDEDKLDANGAHYHEFRKPDWSPARLRCQMYIGHLTLMRRALVDEVGGFRSEFEGSQDYDLALRVTERARAVVHVPEVLYHWRAIEASAATGSEAKPYAYDAAARALREHLTRCGIDGEVEQTHEHGIYRVRRRLSREPLISIIIPTRGSTAVIEGRFRTLVTGAARSIVAKSTYSNYEVVVVADATTPREVVTELDKILGDRLRLVWFERPFNFSDKINTGALEAQGEFLLPLNDDVEIITPDWMETMLGLALDSDVGLVGTMLYFSDGTVQHAGHCHVGGNPFHIGWRARHDDPGYFRALQVERECSGVTAACILLRRSLFFEVGGFCMALPNNFNDVDFSLKILGTGRRIVWTPHAQLFHYESKTRVSAVAEWELAFVHRRWKHRMLNDRFWDEAAAANA